MGTKPPSACYPLWRPPFDEVDSRAGRWFRARDTPLQPLKKQLITELRHSLLNPCDFALGITPWRQVYAVSSSKWIPAVVLLVVRLFFAGAQVYVTYRAVSRDPRTLFFLTTWNTILVSVYFVSLALCSAFAFMRPRQSTTEVENGSGGTFSRIVLGVIEGTSSLVVGTSFVVCLVYWTALYRTIRREDWLGYYQHVCFFPVFFMAFISRVPYRLYHWWIGLLFGTCYIILCCAIAFIPLETAPGRVGYAYPILKYQEEPLKAWLATAAFCYLLAPASYMLFWFALRFNNTAPTPSQCVETGV